MIVLKVEMLWKVLLVLGGAAVVAVVVRTVYYEAPVERDKPPGDFVPVPVVRPEAVLPGNPLLSANRSQFNMWFPPYCGADMFVVAEPDAIKVNRCVNGIIERVESSTGRTLSRNEVLDPGVRAHWRTVMLGG